MLELLDSDKNPLEDKIIEVKRVTVVDRDHRGILDSPRYHYTINHLVTNKGEGYVDHKNSYIISYSTEDTLIGQLNCSIVFQSIAIGTVINSMS